VVCLWGRRIYGNLRPGLVAGGVLLTSYQYFFQARIARTDMLLCCLILLSLYFFYCGFEQRGKRATLLYGLSFFFIGLGILTKGPFGLGIPLLAMAAFLFKEKKIRLFFSAPFFLGYVIVALTVLPWVFLFVKEIGVDRTVTLIRENQILTRSGPIYFYSIEIWTQFFPWSLLLPSLFIHFWRQRKEGLTRGQWFLLLWFGSLFIVLTLFKYRASRYLLPAIVPFSLMLGGMWRRPFATFLIPAILFVFVWHGVEFSRILKDDSRSPGRVLATELKPLVEGAPMGGFQLDVSTVEEVNFYLDRVIPIIKKAEHLSKHDYVLMPGAVYERLRSRGKDSLWLVREFRYKRQPLALVSSRPESVRQVLLFWDEGERGETIAPLPAAYGRTGAWVQRSF
jgi:hypothetical protein